MTPEEAIPELKRFRARRALDARINAEIAQKQQAALDRMSLLGEDTTDIERSDRANEGGIEGTR
jgi:hypothetical protein